MNRANRLTVLLAEPGKAATKTHKWNGEAWETIGFDAGWLFKSMESRPLRSLEDLEDTLIQLSRIDRAMVIRGDLIDSFAMEIEPGRRVSSEPVRRLMYERIDERGNVWDPSFVDCDRTWLAIDIDGAPGAHARAPKDYDRCAQWIQRTYLPSWLQDVGAVYQWSASSGVRPWDTLSIHLWFLLDRPVCSASLREWFSAHAEDYEVIDRTLYNPVQVHYVANPLFDGAPDPIQRRIGRTPGPQREASPPPEIVDLATWDIENQKREEERARRRSELAKDANRRGVRSDKVRIRYAQAARAGKCADILNASKGARHETIVNAGHHLGGLIASGYLDRAETVDMLIDAGAAAYDEARRVKDVPRIVEDAVSLGERKPVSLDHIGASREAQQREYERPTDTQARAGDRFARRKEEIRGRGSNRFVVVCRECGGESEPGDLGFDPKSVEWTCPACGAVPFSNDDERRIATGFNDYGDDPAKWPAAMRESYRGMFG